MKDRPLRTTVIGSYPFPGWLEFVSQNLAQFGPDDIAEAQDDAVIAAVHDQMAAGLDVITDGEQTRLDFNLSFYGYIQGIDLEGKPPRRFGPPAHDQRGKHKVVGELHAPRGLGAVEEFKRGLILSTLRRTAGNRTMAARLLGLQRTYLARLIRDLGVAERRLPARAESSGTAPVAR